QLGKRLAGCRGKPPAVGVELDRAMGAREQLSAERSLEIADPMADRRRRQVERLRSVLETTGAGGDVERLQREQLRRAHRRCSDLWQHGFERRRHWPRRTPFPG